MSSDYDYITLYLPHDGATANEDGRYINEECLNWLNTNVGNGTNNIRSWMLSHDTDEFNWCYLGIDPYLVNDPNSMNRRFLFKDHHKALMFKLIWGGS